MTPKVYKPSIPETNSAVQNGSGNAKNTGKFKARYPDTPLGVGQVQPTTGHPFRRAHTPGGPSGS